jgi:antitoxin component YwqK of YwqJK toxin-antitoxin module
MLDYFDYDQGSAQWHESGRLQSREDSIGQLRYACSFKNGQQQGVEQRWDSRGKLRFQREWDHDQLHGFEQHWDTQGRLEFRRRWVNDVLNGISQRWIESGDLVYQATHDKHGQLVSQWTWGDEPLHTPMET